jgi:DNA-binding transcriptional MerR regulator
MTMGDTDSFTIDELAAAAGMTPRNVRAYRTKGLLSPPIRHGRASRYRTAHLLRLRDIRHLREAGLPLKMIIEAANRGDDLGRNGALWLAAGRPAAREDALTAMSGPAFVADPEAYALMQALTNRGVQPATVLLLALRAAHASSALAAELSTLLDREADGPTLAAGLPVPARADVIDLATVITREMLGHALTT